MYKLCVCRKLVSGDQIGPNKFFDAAMIHSTIPVFICTPQLKNNTKAIRLTRLPKLLKDFVDSQCLDGGISSTPGQDPDVPGENIIGAAWVKFSAVWNPMLPMDDQKRAM